MGHRAGQVIELQTDKFYVYALIDDAGVCFYIGMTSNPTLRLTQHAKNRFNVRVRQKMTSLKTKRLRLLSDGLSERAARALERKLIQEHAGLLNQEHRDDFRTQHERHPVFEKYLRGASSG